MSRRTLVLIVLVLLTLVCCQLVCVGGVDETRYAGRLDLEAPSFDPIRRRFTARLTASQIRLGSGGQAGCALASDRLTVPEDETCIYAIQPDSGVTRQLSLVLGGEGGSVSLVLTQPNAISVDQTLEAGQSIDLDIYKNDGDQGAELIIQECNLIQVEAEEDLIPSGDRNQPYVCILEIDE